MNIQTLKIIYSCIASFATIVAYVISYFLKFERKDLSEIFFGSIMISDALTFMSIDSIADGTSGYPYNFLLALFAFTTLTFYSFFHDSLALLDDSLLVKCDMVNNTPMLSSEDKIQEIEETPKFNFWDNFVSIILFVLSTVECISFGETLSMYTNIYDLNHRLPYIIPVRFFQILCISTILRDTQMTDIWYIFVAILNAICVGVFGSIKSIMSSRACDIFFAVSSSLLLGSFLYFGAIAIHNSFISLAHSRWFSIIIAIVGFLIPSIFRVLMFDSSTW
ncbi:hypothetical protein TVAG_234460 [Trichomonas vaginalis G3]|uniref:Uncharacterized protein n=1 Tax=Trichomonas vaginalis (strain ATCC PRA-98 / G3) TaxID=412133 RepID=A2FPQ2_TRIV3|nr:hypothetical protein TVAGG3_0774750 [Trichomonas vaginalis G3]EAX93128.1 hypothetical protein TVAG_234460 [Trichomonas vaginalis G3]KAI5514089.1 hypothetical protein TVAGG3_0774750 [Trichomonas vaginalis G3]|eukprot:XP_001306058.1 hypothetical protein [Trichomonas vaginalis G3]